MLRYLTFDPNPKRRIVIRFCCSRVIFDDVHIKVPNLSLLFDNEYITKTFKKYKRGKGESTHILTSNCGKCDGYGFYDWVTRLTTNDEEEPVINMGELKPVVVKNENPILLIYHDTSHTYYYVSDFDQSDELIYRCEQCLGTGMAIGEIDRLTEFKPIDEIQQPENQSNILRRLSIWYADLKSKKSSRNRIAHLS